MLFSDARQTAVCALHEATGIYTAGAVARDLLLRLGWPTRTGRLLDPSAGDGSFLVEALKLLRPAPDDWLAADRVRGYEIHPGAVAAARRQVAATLVEIGWRADSARIAASRMVVERDFLVGGGDDCVAQIVTNPPYLRYARVPAYFQSLYRQHVRQYALGDLLHCFLDRCAEILEPGGRIGLISSDRWLFNQSAAGLREAVGRRVGLAHVERLDVASAFYRAKTRVAGSLPRVHPILAVLESGAAPITRAAISPDGAAPDDAGRTLGEVATIRLAPWLGPKGIFVMARAEAERLGAGDWVPVVDTDDVDPTTDLLSAPARLALRTRRDEEPQGALARHLQVERARMPARGRRGPYWMPPEQLRPEASSPSLMVPRIARRFRVIDLPAGVQAINHNLTLIGKGALDLEAIRAILLAPESDEWLRANAPRLEGGFFSITTSLIRRLPVPVRFRSD